MSTETQAPSTRPLWIGLFLLTAAGAAVTAGWLAHAGGANVPTAVLTGGGAFGGTLGVLLALAHFAGLPGGR